MKSMENLRGEKKVGGGENGMTANSLKAREGGREEENLSKYS